MEKVKRILTLIASTPDHEITSKLPILHRRLIPLLSFASSIYHLSVFFRHRLYRWGLFRKQRLPVPVVSVGNLTWGGNGKTPMAEFLALLFAEAGIPPLILTRGYAGGDEAKMLHRHLFQTTARVGVGANRSETASFFFESYGYMDPHWVSFLDKLSAADKLTANFTNDKVGAVILDDGMQHWSLLRDLDIVMVNGMMPWGNGHLLPRGPLRESLNAFKRADIAVIHHADLVSDRQLILIESTMQKVKKTLPVFFSRSAPSYFFEVTNHQSKWPLSKVFNMVILCVSAIGFPEAFASGIQKIGPLYVDQLEFTDHHSIQADDIELIKERLQKLEGEFAVKAIVVVTEKDYDRDPVILSMLEDFEVLVLCSSLKVVPHKGRTEEELKELLMKILKQKYHCKLAPC